MNVVVLLSGGLDSTTMLYHLKAEGHRVSALSVYYRQRHASEVDAAVAVAKAAGVPHSVAHVAIDLPGSALTDLSVAVPHGHYQDASMRSTVVPNRNMILLALGMARAFSIGFDAVAYAAHAGDHAIYPDCRPEFFHALNEAADLAHYDQMVLMAPFLTWTKGQIAKRALELGVPVELTWTCYEGGSIPCGKCGACVERAEAFAFAGAPDPRRKR